MNGAHLQIVQNSIHFYKLISKLAGKLFFSSKVILLFLFTYEELIIMDPLFCLFLNLTKIL